MSEILDHYRGANIYEFSQLDESEGIKLGVKLIAKALLPESQNVQVDFIEEAQNQEKALKKLHKAIDTYLDHHGIKEFVHDA